MLSFTVYTIHGHKHYIYAKNANILASAETRPRNAALQIIDCLLAQQLESSRKQTGICYIEIRK